MFCRAYHVEKIVTTEGEALEFHFFDGRVKEVPILLFRSNHNTLGANLPFPGYNWTSAGYVPKQDEVPMVRMVYELYADGMKIERIREAVEAAGYSSFRGKVSHRFITRMLDDERYSGRRTVNGEIIENDHEAIIPRAFHAGTGGNGPQGQPGDRARKAEDLQRKVRTFPSCLLCPLR
jgi:hypothetical protein